MWHTKSGQTPESLARVVPSPRVTADILKTKGWMWLVTGLDVVCKCLDHCLEHLSFSMDA